MTAETPGQRHGRHFQFARRVLKVVPGILVALEARGLALEVSGRGKILVAWDRIDALSTATVSEGDEPILVIDLVLNWTSIGEDPLRVITEARVIAPIIDGPRMVCVRAVDVFGFESEVVIDGVEA